MLNSKVVGHAPLEGGYRNHPFVDGARYIQQTAISFMSTNRFSRFRCVLVVFSIYNSLTNFRQAYGHMACKVLARERQWLPVS